MIKAIMAITAITIIIPTHIPALKISPIASHPENRNRKVQNRIKRINLFIQLLFG